MWALIFDLDGTLIDTVYAHVFAWQRALAESGRRVPEDVSVVGFDDIPESAFFLPPLTTVRQDFGELGRQALRLLVDRICGRPAPGARLPVAPELIVRASAARPRPAR